MRNKENKLTFVLSIQSFFPNFFGGGQIYVYRLAKELLQRNYNATVLTYAQWNGAKDPYIIKRYTYENIPVVTFNLNPENISAAEKYITFGSLTSQVICKILHELNPDIVLINGIKPALTVVCKELSIPHIVTAHHVGIACPAGSLLLPDYTICDITANSKDCVPCCNYSRRPKWYTGGVLGRIPQWIYRPIGKRLNRVKSLSYFERGLIYPWLVEQSLSAQKIVLEQARLIVSPSLSIRDQLIRNGCDPAKIRVIPHGINPMEKLPFGSFDDRLVRFGYIGRINPPKGLHIILDALEFLPEELNCELHIYGGTQYTWEEEYLDEILNNYKGNSKIFTHGYIPHEKIVEAFANIDVLIVPSLIPEAFGLVVMEAFSAGRPVIVSTSGALPELVRHGIDGFVVDRNDSKALLRELRKFLETPDLIYEMSKQIPHVKNTSEYVDKLEVCYGTLLKEKDPAPINLNI